SPGIDSNSVESVNLRPCLTIKNFNSKNVRFPVCLSCIKQPQVGSIFRVLLQAIEPACGRVGCAVGNRGIKHPIAVPSACRCGSARAEKDAAAISSRNRHKQGTYVS